MKYISGADERRVLTVKIKARPIKIGTHCDSAIQPEDYNYGNQKISV